MISLKQLIEEILEKPAFLIKNPNYNNTTWWELMRKFSDDGGTVYSGKYSQVLVHPKWNYVLKIFPNDNFYLRFIRFVMKNPRKSFPKLFDKPRKIIPNYKRTKEDQFLYVVPIEKLYSINSDEWDDLNYYLYYGPSDKEDLIISSNQYESWKDILERVKKIEKKYPNIDKFKEDFEFFENARLGGSIDFHRKNFMKRDNGEFVISDPLWEGETVDQTYDRLMKAEMDYYGGQTDSSEPEYIQGGEKYKKPKKPKPTKKPIQTLDKDEVPF